MNARGRPLEDIFPIINEDTHQPVENPARRVMREEHRRGAGQSHAPDIQGWPPDPHRRDSGAPIFDTDGNGTGVVLVSAIRATSGRHRRRWLKARARFRCAVENNPHPMWVYDLETLAFLEVNDAAVAHYGYSRDEFLSMRLPDIGPPEDVERLTDDVRLERPALQRSGEWRHKLKTDRSSMSRSPLTRSSSPGARRCW